MGKLGKTVTKATYGILDLALKPVYDQMKKERKLEVRNWNESLKIADEDARVDAMQPRRFEVVQMQDPIIGYRSIW